MDGALVGAGSLWLNGKDLIWFGIMFCKEEKWKKIWFDLALCSEKKNEKKIDLIWHRIAAEPARYQ